LSLEEAATQCVDEFSATVRVWKADADGDLDGSRLVAHQHDNRRACWYTGPDGMVHIRADLAPDAGAIVAGALHAISERLWRDKVAVAARCETADHTPMTPASSSSRCETADHTPITAAAMRRLACDAGVTPVILGGPTVELGTRRRTITRAQRNALIVRDGGRVFPGCDRPPSWCDGHHVIHWLNHGPSELWNLTLLCSAHHRAV